MAIFWFRMCVWVVLIAFRANNAVVVADTQLSCKQKQINELFEILLGPVFPPQINLPLI